MPASLRSVLFTSRRNSIFTSPESADGGQDPVDGAIPAAAAKKAATDLPKLIKFVPFDPPTKMSEATATDPGRATVRAVKGAFAEVAKLTPIGP